MKSILMGLFLVSAAQSQVIEKYDTTVTLRSTRPDSFYIYPLNQYIDFHVAITASCPTFISGDFVGFGPPNQNANVERIPAETKPLLQVTTHCEGSEITGVKAGKTYSIADRYYKIKTGTKDVYFRIAEVSSDDKVRLEFSDSPYSTGIVHYGRDGIRNLRKEKPILETKKGIHLINGKHIATGRRLNRF